MTRSFTVIANKGSGSHADGELRQVLRRQLEDQGVTVTFIELDPTAGGERMGAAYRTAVTAAKGRGDIVVAAGGDGTLNGIAAECHRQGVAMGIIPMGTFNYFAREHHIPLDLAAAVDLLRDGPLQPTRIGAVNDHVFLVNASLGLYSTIIRNRESDKATFGRHRFVAAISAVITLFRVTRVFHVDIETPTGRVTRKTMMVFICNNHLQMAKLGLAGGDDNPPGTLDLVIMKPANAWQRFRILALSAIGKLKLEKRLDEYTAPAFTVNKKTRIAEIVMDGEIIRLPTPLHFKALSDGLHVIRPTGQDE